MNMNDLDRMIREGGISDKQLSEIAMASRLDCFLPFAFNVVSPGEAFMPNWHLDAITHHLHLVEQGVINRLLITMPPRSCKSIATSTAFAAWYLGRHPDRSIICASYNDALAIKLHNDTRAILRLPAFQRAFPECRLDRRKDSESEVRTTAMGSRLATTVDGTMTGRGANLIIIDDAIKPLDALSDVRRSRVNDWFDTTVIQRLNNKTRDAIIVVMQRVHEDDLAGHILEKEGFVHLCLPAIAPADDKVLVGPGLYHHRREGDVLHPERESFEDLMRIKADIGSHAFVTQYLQEGVPLDGALVKWSWFRSYDRLPEKSSKTLVVQSWDFANTANPNSDWSVCTTWHIVNDEFYLADVYRVRLDFPGLCQAVVQQRQKWNPDIILVEEAGAGMQILQHFKHMHMRLRGVRPDGDKAMRLSAQSAKIEAGRVYLPRQADWLETFRMEMLAFPRGRHDDQVDSFSQLLGWHSNRATLPGIARF